MASFKQYTASGGASEAFSIKSFSSDEIKVRVDGVLKTATTHYNITSYTANGGTVTWTSGNVPSSGTVRIYRITDTDPARATFATGSSLKAADLNNNQTQLLRGIEEENDQLIQEWDVEDGAITSNKIKDGSISNADISGTAELDVSKLKDGSARQLLQTDAAGTGVEWASNIKVPGTFQSVGAAQFDNSITCNTASTLSGTLATGALTTTGNIAVSGTVDGRDVAADGTKLDGIEAGATADQSNAEIRAAVEAASDSNVFTDADHSKLNAIEAGATADQTNAEIRAAVEAATDSNVFTDADHSKLNAIEASADVTDATNVDSAGAIMNSDLDGKGELLVGDGSGDPSALAVGTNDHVLTADSSTATGLKWAAASGGGSALTIKEEGTALATAASSLNFVGGSVTASGTGADKTITITDANTTYTTSFVDSSNDCILRLTDSGSGTDDLKFVAGSNITLTPSGDNLTIAASGGEVTVQEEGTSLSTAATTINFVGAGVTASGTGATKTITISGGGGAVTTDFQYLELKAHNDTSTNATFNGSIHDYELVTKGTTTAVDPGQAAALLISIGGVIQEPNTGTSIGSNDGFCVDGSSIHFGGNLDAAPDYILWLKGAGSHTIADDSIAEVKLDIHNAPSGTDKYLKYTSNGMEWATAGSGTPEGTAILSTGETGTAKFLRIDGDNSCSWQVPPDTNTQVGGATGVDFNDDVKVRFGTGNDLEIYYDPDTGGVKRSIINHIGQGFLQIKHDGDNACSFSDGHLSVNTASSGASGIEIQGSGDGYITFTPSSGTAPIIKENNTNIQIKTAGVVRSEFSTTGINVTGECIATDQITGRGFECPATVSDDWTIAAANNAMFPGPMTVAANKTVTVPANRTLTIV